MDFEQKLDEALESNWGRSINDEVMELYMDGYKIMDIADMLSIGKSEVRRILKANGIKLEVGIDPSFVPLGDSEEYEYEPNMMESHNKIKGGLADKSNPSDFNAKQLKKGIKVEREHTNSDAVAKEIAMDHLKEDPKYYDKLAKMENN